MNILRFVPGILALMLAGNGYAESTQAPRDAVPAYQAPKLVFAGCVIDRFRWRNKLIGWRYGRDTIGTALTSWLEVPAERQYFLTNCVAAELRELLTERLPAVLREDDTLLFYLGTHHLRKGRILFAQRDYIEDHKLAEWLSRIPQRIIFMADVCYAERMERNCAFPRNIFRIYGSKTKQLAPEIDLDGRFRAMLRFFEDTDRIVRSELGADHTLYSMMGYVFLHSLLLEMRRGPMEISMDSLFRRMHDEQVRLRHFTRRHSKTPELVAYNVHPWPLAAVLSRLPATGAASAFRPSLPTPAPAPAEPTAARRGLACRTVEEMLELPDPDIDIAYGNLLIGKWYEADIKVHDYLAQLDGMAAELKSRIEGKRDPDQIVRLINSYLFEEKGFIAEAEPYNEDFLLHDLLRTRRGRCSALVALYMGLAERVGLPMTSVCVPQHIFVRWHQTDRTSGGLWRIPATSADRTAAHSNIETTKRGTALPDEIYRQRCGREMTEKAVSFYLRSLTKKETLATFLSPLGSALREQNRLDEAVAACRLAISVNVNDAEAWNNLAMTYRMQDMAELAIASYRKALKITPDFAEVWNNYGSVEPDLPERINHYKKAVTLKPELEKAWRNLAMAYFDHGDYDLSAMCVRRYHGLGYRMQPDFLETLKNRMD